jgi:hypothetical protein
MTFGFAAALGAGACGSAEFSPTAPSRTGTAGSGAVISGRVTGIAAAMVSSDTFGTMDSSSVTVTVVGTNISTTLNGSGQFTLNGVPGGTVQLQFSGRGVNATVTIAGVSTSDRIDITVALNGNSARVESERRERRNNGNAEAEGTVSGLTGTCPNLTFTVQSTRVTTNNATAFDDITCATFVNGARVEVKGERQTDGSILASRVEGDDDDDDDDNGSGRGSKMEGAVASLTGQCPNLSFTLNGMRVTTTAQTAFKDVTCAALRNGTRVEVHGERQSADSILASRVEPEDD